MHYKSSLEFSIKLSGSLICLALLFVQSARSQNSVNIDIDTNKPIAHVSKEMWGIFFEDINFAADGGLYAELVKNRSFEFPMPLMGWKQLKTGGKQASLLIVNHQKAGSSHARHAAIDLIEGPGSFVLSNEGFRGIGLEKDKQYRFSIAACSFSDSVKIRIEAEDPKNEIVGSAKIDKLTSDWQTYTVIFKCKETTAKARLNVIFEGKGKVEVDMISLFPRETWKNRENGLRADLAQKLADLHPGFMRFPGGCIVEGRELLNRYQWKKTIGPTDGRELLLNRWNVEFAKRSAPDYYQSFGLGFFEYFQFCEDIGASPLPILNCGMACQYNSAEVVSLDQLDPYIQDALDLIDFANGPQTSKWGALRAQLGHPKPFNLRLLGIGNEQWGEQYIERFKLFAAVLKSKYPEVKLISSAGPSPNGTMFDLLNKKLREEKAELIDEHYYRDPEWFLKNVNRYDTYERKDSKVFAGEYAVHIPDNMQKDTHAESHNTIWSALCEAAFMTGLERNADVVQMASYAPLLASIEAWQWRPDLIWFDNLHSVATPNYYVQQMFAVNKGDVVLSTLSKGKPLAGQDSIYATSSIDTVKGNIIVKLINTSLNARTVNLNLSGSNQLKDMITWIELSDKDKSAFNSLDNPQAVKPEMKTIKLGKRKTFELKGLSANVLVLPLSKKSNFNKN